MKTKVEYCEKLIPMEEDMESNVVKALGLHKKDQCIITAEQVLNLFKEYSQSRDLPTEWEAYVRNVLSNKRKCSVCGSYTHSDEYDEYYSTCSIECTITKAKSE